MCQLHLGDQTAALADYDRALAINPEYALAIWDKALIHSEQEDYEAALSGLEEVLRLSPYSAAIVYKDKGNIYYKLEQF